MANTDLTISINNDNLTVLKKIASEKKCDVSTVINEILAKNLEGSDASKSLFPSVALIKDGLNLDKPIMAKQSSSKGMLSHSPSTSFNVPNGPANINPQALKRRKEIEAEMSELSLLIETATEDKKDGYAMQYAQLASELNALL